MIAEGTRPKGGKRRGRTAGATAAPRANDRPLYRRLSNPFSPIRIFSDDQVAALHETALALLEDTGIRVLHPDARDRLAAAGAAVDPASLMVRIDRGLVAQALAAAPREFEIHGGASERAVAIGGRNVAVSTVGGPPNTSGRSGKRPGTLRDYQDFMRLAQSFDVIHLLNQCVEPLDVPWPKDISMSHTHSLR